MISIKKCLEVMHSGAVFGLKVVSYDKRRKEQNGQVTHYPSAVLVWGDGGNDRTRERDSEREPTALERTLTRGASSEAIKRDPGHAAHYTRNIRLMVDGKPTEIIKKIHPALIIEFNGEITTP